MSFYPQSQPFYGNPQQPQNSWGGPNYPIYNPSRYTGAPPQGFANLQSSAVPMPPAPYYQPPAPYTPQPPFMQHANVAPGVYTPHPNPPNPWASTPPQQYSQIPPPPPPPFTQPQGYVYNSNLPSFMNPQPPVNNGSQFAEPPTRNNAARNNSTQAYEANLIGATLKKMPTDVAGETIRYNLMLETNVASGAMNLITKNPAYANHPNVATAKNWIDYLGEIMKEPTPEQFCQYWSDYRHQWREVYEWLMSVGASLHK